VTLRIAIIIVAVAVVGLRVWRHRRSVAVGRPSRAPGRIGSDAIGNPVLLVAWREISERVRGRIFRVGTLIILLVVGAAIVIPVLHKTTTTPQRVAVVGGNRAAVQQIVKTEADRVATSVRFVSLDSTAAAKRELRSGAIDLAILDGQRIVTGTAIARSDGTDTSNLAYSVAAILGVERSYSAAGLTPAQLSEISGAKPVPVQSLQSAPHHSVNGTSVIGVILVFLMLTQYTTWILMGVMQEKASRVVEVLLATMRPIQLLAGKVLGIGLVAMGQAALILTFALILGAAVGSNILHGSEPIALVSALVWLLLGYAFYSWVYAAAGSMAERQDQVQTLVLPLTLPMIVGYVIALTTASTGNPSLFFKVLAYLPPTAPFAMPVLVGLGDVKPWEFALSVLITLASTLFVARAAAAIYMRAVLRTGARVPLRELLRGTGR
jgi:ABC-2 type transport system permease protein